MTETVSRDEFEGRKAVEDERFKRGKESIDRQDEGMRQITTLIATTSQLVQQHDRKIDKQDETMDRIGALTEQTSQLVRRHDEMLAKHDQRLGKLEERPGKRWDALIVGLISAAAGVLITWMATRAGA